MTKRRNQTENLTMILIKNQAELICAHSVRSIQLRYKLFLHKIFKNNIFVTSHSLLYHIVQILDDSVYFKYVYFDIHNTNIK